MESLHQQIPERISALCISIESIFEVFTKATKRAK